MLGSPIFRRAFKRGCAQEPEGRVGFRPSAVLDTVKVIELRRPGVREPRSPLTSEPRGLKAIDQPDDIVYRPQSFRDAKHMGTGMTG